MVKNLKKPKLDTIFRIQTMMILSQKPVSGYQLSKELEALTGNKPSTGKIYPFLHELKEFEYVEEIEDPDENPKARSKSIYQITEKGLELVEELLLRMENIIESRLDQLLDTCFHCGVKIHDPIIFSIDKKGVKRFFCCEHCMKHG